MSNNNKIFRNRYEEAKCIWMAASVVNYKLCDRDFDCENCQFDKVMQSHGKSSSGFVDPSPASRQRNYLLERIDKILEQPYDPSCYYINNNLVVKHLFSNTYYLGISSTATLLLDNLNSVCDCEKNSYVLLNDPIFKFSGDWGSIAVRAPMNLMFLEKINVPGEELSLHKWLGIVAINPMDLTPAKISEQEWYNRRISLANYLKDYSHIVPDIGTTLNDGGQQVKYLYQLIGKQDYLKLLRLMFQP